MSRGGRYYRPIQPEEVSTPEKVLVNLRPQLENALRNAEHFRESDSQTARRHARYAERLTKEIAAIEAQIAPPTPTPPPLDLAALRRRIDRAKERPAPPGLAGLLALDALALIARVEELAGESYLYERAAQEAIARAEAAEAKIAAVRDVISRYHEVGGHVCDDLDDPCARCVADEAMDALDGTA